MYPNPTHQGGYFAVSFLWGQQCPVVMGGGAESLLFLSKSYGCAPPPPSHYVLVGWACWSRQVLGHPLSPSWAFYLPTPLPNTWGYSSRLVRIETRAYCGVPPQIALNNEYYATKPGREQRCAVPNVELNPNIHF